MRHLCDPDAEPNALRVLQRHTRLVTTTRIKTPCRSSNAREKHAVNDIDQNPVQVNRGFVNGRIFSRAGRGDTSPRSIIVSRIFFMSRSAFSAHEKIVLLLQKSTCARLSCHALRAGSAQGHSANPSIHPSVSLPVCLSLCLSACLSESDLQLVPKRALVRLLVQ